MWFCLLVLIAVKEPVHLNNPQGKEFESSLDGKKIYVLYRRLCIS
jgi:hypothetical protein